MQAFRLLYLKRISNWDEQSVHLGTNISPLLYERNEPEDKYNHILIILITFACPKKKSQIMIIWVRPTGVSTKYISTNYTVDRHIVDLLLPLISVQWFMDWPWACKCSNSAADDHGIKTPQLVGDDLHPIFLSDMMIIKKSFPQNATPILSFYFHCSLISLGSQATSLVSTSSSSS